MQFFADLLLATAATGAALYCLVLSRRLKALGSLEGGMGNAIAVLSRQVDDLSKSLKVAQEAAGRTAGTLDGQTERAQAAARRLELLLASLHDLPGSTAEPDTSPARAPSPWPTESSRLRFEPEPDPSPPQRARILRRRHGPEGV